MSHMWYVLLPILSLTYTAAAAATITTTTINNHDNRTEWSPIRSVIIRVINKIGRPQSRSPIC